MKNRPLVLASSVVCAALVFASVADADPLAMPAMTGPLQGNSKPMAFDTGPFGKVYLTGAFSGLAFHQDNVSPGDRGSLADLSNGQIFIQKTDGPIQFFVQAGAYSLPDLGTAYLRASKATGGFYGGVPQAFIKFAPSDTFSIMAGKLPTLMGAEYTFSFENMNIERGLLWNQENAVNRGVQANYAKGPLTVSASWNDGFYSKRYNWLSTSIAYAINPSNTITFVGTGNTSSTARSSLATPLVQNNEQLYNLIYTYTSGPWTVTPYLQYTRVPQDTALGIVHSASTLGAALLGKYSFNDKFSLAARVEYIGSTGSVANGAPSLIYGPGSNAWSFTITPTYQRGIFFARAEFSYVGANGTTPGFALGPFATKTTQSRAMLEAGVLF
ncbi:MAG TPA: porin [Xanthomonadaceae bacterium]|nr:porin [Xanthomonadaceae bacterium]